MKSIPLYKFYRKKYHKELLMDLVDIAFIRPWLKKTPIYRDNFYRVIFITDGEGELSVNNHVSTVSKGQIICSVPGEVWHWFSDNGTLEGYVLLFEEKFLLSFFSDNQFLERLPFLAPDRISPFLQMDTVLYGQISNLLQLTKDEISKRETADPHFLRAMLYALLILTGRADAGYGSDGKINVPVSRHVEKFIRLVNAHFISEHNTEFYADKLCVTTNYLNKIVKGTLGTTTKLYIQDRIMEEARKLLAYTNLSSAEIADILHFNTATYFNRFFTRNGGLTPQKFRESLSSPEK